MERLARIGIIRFEELLERAFGLSPGAMMVSGDSAGANLALALMLHELAEGRLLPDGALLFYGVYDDDFESRSYDRFAEGYGLTRDKMRRYWNWYAPEFDQRSSPLAAPLKAPDEALRALPTLFLSAAGLDPLACDTLKLAERLRALDRRDELCVYPGVVHGFMQMTSALTAARQAFADAGAAGRRMIHASYVRQPGRHRMRRMMTIFGAAASLLATAAVAEAQTVRFWYHFDNPDNPMDELIQKFDAENPEITIEAENVPWNSYYDNLYTAIVGGSAPDAAMVKLFAQPRLLEMGALEPLDERTAAWDGKADLLDDLLETNQGPDGRQYYLPVQYVVLYLYYRPDLFQEAGRELPATCEDFLEAAKALTKDTNGDGQIDVYGFGFRGGRGGHDHWAPFVLSQRARFEPGGMTDEQAVTANQWVIDLHREHNVFPPSAPNDGFQEIMAGSQQGRAGGLILGRFGLPSGP